MGGGGLERANETNKGSCGEKENKGIFSNKLPPQHPMQRIRTGIHIKFMSFSNF